MYMQEYKRWMEAELEDFDLKAELQSIEGDEGAIEDRFAVSLKFGTAGLRGTLGAGTNRMNIWVVRQATQGIADWVKTQGGTQTVAISYDSRLKGWDFAKNAAGVLAANGIKVRIYDALMPVPALSFATRYYQCNAGIMVTASHNPAQYNGYKAYGPDGCQMTDDAAAVVYDVIQKTDVLTGAKIMSFAEGVEKGLIQFVGDDCKAAFYEAIEARQVRPGLARTAGLKLVYSPLNGTGLVPVTQVLKDIGITDITIVPEQEYPNGYFTTCSYPNPEIFAALEKGLELAKEVGADLMLATDPDADRVGIAMKCPDGTYEWAFCFWTTSVPDASNRGPCRKNPLLANPSCPHLLPIWYASTMEWRCVRRSPDSSGSVIRSPIWKRTVKWTVSSSGSKRATDIWPDLTYVTRTRWSLPCSSARWQPTIAASDLPSRNIWKNSTHSTADT